MIENKTANFVIEICGTLMFGTLCILAIFLKNNKVGKCAKEAIKMMHGTKVIKEKFFSISQSTRTRGLPRRVTGKRFKTRKSISSTMHN